MYDTKEKTHGSAEQNVTGTLREDMQDQNMLRSLQPSCICFKASSHTPFL